MEKATDKKLYQSVKAKADKIYARPGLYKSAYIQKEYQRLGGTYSGKKPDTNKGVQRWLTGENWVEVSPYLKDNKKVKCGTTPNMNKACRALVRVNDKTPITIPELLKIHSKSKLLELVEKKKKDMDGRIMWRKGIFKPSK